MMRSSPPYSRKKLFYTGGCSNVILLAVPFE
uniref:Uncharacterized protein n=1 Tax=Arundo donax TaxID=35708 RepID=A0A0A8YZ80_ARUDO